VGGHRGLRQQCSPQLINARQQWGHLAFDGKLPRVKIGCTRLCVTARRRSRQGRKNELGTNASINPNTTKAVEITAAAPTARESKRLTECRQTGTDWVPYRWQVERGDGRGPLTRGERQPKHPASETAEG
jgi:hypothetical protein